MILLDSMSIAAAAAAAASRLLNGMVLYCDVASDKGTVTGTERKIL